MNKKKDCKIKCIDAPIGAMISSIHRSRMIYLNHSMKDENITFGQFPYLLILLYHENLSQEELARNIRIDKGTVARNIKKLEDKELIKREIDENNRRQYKLSLTNKGISTATKLKKYEKKWEKMVFEEISLDEKHLKEEMYELCKKTYYYAKKSEARK